MTRKQLNIILITIAFSLFVIIFSNATSKFFRNREDAASLSYVIIFLCRSILGMLILPLLYIKYFLKKSISDFGFRFPENNYEALLITGIVIFASIPFLFYFSISSDFKSLYLYGNNLIYQIILQMVVLSAFYYFAEEFLFRGLLLFSLWGAYGYLGVIITNIIFMFFHLAKPMPEVIFAFFSGLAFSYLAIRSKSFLPAALAHYAIALILNIIINFY